MMEVINTIRKVIFGIGYYPCLLLERIGTFLMTICMGIPAVMLLIYIIDIIIDLAKHKISEMDLETIILMILGGVIVFVIGALFSSVIGFVIRLILIPISFLKIVFELCGGFESNVLVEESEWDSKSSYQGIRTGYRDDI